MKFASNGQLPKEVSSTISTYKGATVFRKAYNLALSLGNSRVMSFVEGYTALEKAGYAVDGNGVWRLEPSDLSRWDKFVSTVAKKVGINSENKFSEEDIRDHLIPAMNKAMDGKAHVELMGSPKKTINNAAKFIKVDEEQRIAWGWASVSTVKGELVVDTDEDTISPEEMVKMANAFMLDVRTAKAMHKGNEIGEVIHSLPLTDELAKAFGIESDTEGWIIGMKIHSDEIWEQVKTGELEAFSIGGLAMTEEINAE